MRNGTQQQNEPRSRLILRRTEEAIRSSGTNALKFASAVAESYMATLAPRDRVIEFYSGAGSMESALKAQKNNGNLVDRLMKGVVRFPVDLEEAWIAALPEPHCSNLVRELASRYGLTGMRAPMRTAHEHVATLADVMQDAGEIAKAMAPMLSDINYADREHLQASFRVVSRALDDVLELREQLGRQIGIVDTNVPALRKG